MPSRFLLRFACCLLAALFFVAPVCAEEADTVTLDFVEGDIRAFIQTISELTGRNFVIDPQVTGTITITSPQEIPRRALFRVFENILNTYDFQIIPSGEVFRIVPARTAKSIGEVGIGDRLPPGASPNQVVTQVLPLTNISSQELMNSLRPLLSNIGSILAHDESNTVVLTDVAKNVRRLVEVARLLDTSQGTESLFTFPLRNASAERVASILRELFSVNDVQRRPRNPQQTTRAENFQVVADERTNMLLVIAPPQLRGRLESTISQLDVELDTVQSSIHVYNLENADAVELAKILSEKDLWTSQPDDQVPQGGRVIRGRQPAQQESFLEEVAITADPSTNSLVIKADPQQYREILGVVERLDAPRRQVLVEALIAEVTSNVTRDLGVEWRVLEETTIDGDDVLGLGSGTFPTGAEGSTLNQIVTNPAASPSGIVIGAASGVVTFNGQDILSIAGVARAFQGNTKINILSTPHLLTTDHEEAEIIVGEERPFLSSTQLTSNDSTINSFEYKDVGVTLRITPHISKGGRVRLEIFKEIKDFLAQTELGAITTTKRTATTTVVVDSSQMVVIGGLIRNADTRIESAVPCVGDIPLLGWLFKAASRSRAKTNLLMFLTPHVLQEPGEIDPFTERRLQELPSQESEERTLMDWGFPEDGVATPTVPEEAGEAAP